MSTAEPKLQPAPPPLQDLGEETGLLKLLDVVLDNLWLIAVVTAAAIALGAAYMFVSTPIYEANNLIQVEESKPGNVAGGLGDVSGLFEIHSPASAEIEILRSRLVVGQAVQNLQLDLNVTPKYVPMVGRWLARHATQVSDPGFLGMGGYISGNEALKVVSFDVPAALEGARFSVVLSTQGYELLSPDGDVLGKGAVGQPLDYAVDGEQGRLLVASAAGKPGATFYLARSALLDETEELQRSLNIKEQGRQSGVIRASLQGSDPLRLARVLNEIGALYVRQNVERKSAEAEKSLDFLASFLPQLREQLEISETKFNQFRNQSGTFDLGTEAKAVLDQAVALQAGLLLLQQKRQELEARFTAQHPSVQAIDAQINSINANISALGGRVKSFPNVEQELLRLTRDVKVNSELYASLLISAQQLRLVKEGKVGNVRIVDVAAVPKKRVKPQGSMPLAAVLGLLAGLALAYMRSSLRSGIKDPADIEKRLGLNVFATVPHSDAQVARAKDTKGRDTRVLAVSAPQDLAVESLRSLRTALQFAMLDSANNVVLITGPKPEVGKTFTSVNFTAVLGAVGKKVVLLDADLRKGHIHEYFGLERGHGLSEVVSGSVKLEDALHRQVAPNVDFLATGTLPPNPAELLATPAMQALLQQLASQYDLVIIDTPPVLAASDAAILAPLAGAVFLVARAEVTSLEELQESAKRLAQSGAQTRGVIFNDINLSKRRYGYGLGYKYIRYKYTDYHR
jgi:tyrosine-protein kinase Etk/Wzc